MQENIHCVYMHINKFNGKKYIGQTCKKNPNQRWRDGKGYCASTFFYRAIQKYGWENFEHIILFDGLSIDEANKKEIEMIDFYKTTNEKFGYNLRSGGSRGKQSELTKQKISESRIGEKHHFYGKHLSEEHKEKLRMSSTGYKHTDEAKQKISEALKGKYVGINNHNYGKKRPADVIEKIRRKNTGKKLSDETKQKIGNSHKGKKPPDWQLDIAHSAWTGCHHSEETKIKMGKPVLQFDKQGNFIKRFEYITKAKEKLGINPSHISQCCAGNRKSAGGYIWKFAEKGDD